MIPLINAKHLHVKDFTYLVSPGKWEFVYQPPINLRLTGVHLFAPSVTGLVLKQVRIGSGIVYEQLTYPWIKAVCRVGTVIIVTVENVNLAPVAFDLQFVGEEVMYCSSCGSELLSEAPCSCGTSGTRCEPKTDPNLQAVKQYPCLRPGCFSFATYFAKGNEAKFGHVCRFCHAEFRLEDQNHYVHSMLQPKRDVTGLE